MKTDQLDLWTGRFGEDYMSRNPPSEALLAPRRLMWRRILEAVEAGTVTTVLEVGANLGLNLRMLGELTDARLFAVEPNASARERLVDDGVLPAERVHDGAAHAIPLDDDAFDLAFTSGVLIHIHPDDLLPSCAEIHRVATRYIACIEYFNAEAAASEYRGRAGQLFKRDFGGFWLDNFPDLSVVDYGFFWKRVTGLDDLTWWLFRKG